MLSYSCLQTILLTLHDLSQKRQVVLLRAVLASLLEECDLQQFEIGIQDTSRYVNTLVFLTLAICGAIIDN